MMLAAQREHNYTRGPAAPSHHAVAVQDLPRAGRAPSTGGVKDIYTRKGWRRIKAAGTSQHHNKLESRAVAYACGKGVDLLRATDGGLCHGVA